MTTEGQVIPFGVKSAIPAIVSSMVTEKPIEDEAVGIPRSEIPTPIYDKFVAEGAKLDKISSYKSDFDYSVYRKLEQRYAKKPIRGGIFKGNAMKLVNSHNSCQQCLYAFEIDTYGRGCTHNCLYCYAKAELTVYGYWNNPIPVPININEVRKIFYTVFETDKKSKWRSIMEKKIPLRIGCMSDSFMWIDHKHKLSQELLKILKHYRYPYTILTRSDLLAQDDYIALLDKDLCSVQYSMASTNEKLSSIIEAGAPSPARRLAAIKKISDAGFWVTVRINPILPIYPDGYFTNPDFSWDGAVPKFDFSSFEMVDEIAATGCKSIITGFGRFSSYSINQMEKATGINLRQFFDRENVCKSARDWHYSDKEIRYYYEEYKRRCERVGVEKTVCYIGNGESHFWKHQDLWSNKKDCCNIKGKVKGFKSDTRSLKFDERLKFTSQKCSTPVDQSKLHTELGEAMEKTGPVLKNRLEKDDTNKPEVRL